jgi:hypothetical protein
MKDGLYRARFVTPLGAGYGVVTALDGKLSGGDSRSFYVGSYSLEGDQVFVELRIRRHNRRVILPSVLGANQATVQINGRFVGTQAKLSGYAIGKSPVKIRVTIDQLPWSELSSVDHGGLC